MPSKKAQASKPETAPGFSAPFDKGRIILVNGEPRWMMPLSALTPDDGNINKHSDKSIGEIKGSLERFDQQKPLVLKRRGDEFVVSAGNGQYYALLELKREEAWVTLTQLQGLEAKAYAFADNASAKHSTLDEEAIERLVRELKSKEISLEGLGRDEGELEALLSADDTDDDKDQNEGKSQMPDQLIYKIVITCADETQQTQLLRRFAKEKIKCEALIS